MKSKSILNRFILVSISCIFFSVLSAQTQIGKDIAGEVSQDISGSSVSLSSDGSIVAIGAPRNDRNTGTWNDNGGHVRVYENISGTWTQIGSDIDGESTYDNSGQSVSLSSDGSVVAIGAPLNDGNGNNSGHVRLYKNISGTWTQIGGDIDGEAANDRSGSSVSLSSDGSIVAIGAADNDGTGPNSGQVRLYKNISGTWTQIGEDIDMDEEGVYSGVSVSLSSDGSIVAIGTPGNDGNGEDAGHVRLYENVSGTWTQIGKDIEGGVNFDRSGEFVSLSSDGNTVAIGAPGSFVQVPAVGGQRVYKNVSGTWTQIGSDIAGGGPVSLSSDGSIVAIGSPRSWRVKLYENVSGTWTQIGSDIRGKVPGAADGASVSLSSDGSIVAIGAPALNQNSPGHVKVYENENSNVGIDPSLEKPFIQVYPNPTTNEINITVAPSLVGASYTLCNSNGQSIQEGTIQSISTLLKLDSFPEGVYLLQIGNNLKQTFRVIKE